MNKRLTRIFITVYAAALVLFTVYAALDTFVIPHKMSAAEQVVSGSETVPGKTDTPGITKTPHGATTLQESATTMTQPDPVEQTAISPDADSAQTAMLSVDGEIIGSYDNGETRITITQIREYDTDIYVADVVLSSPDALRTALAYDTYGRNVKQETSEIAEDNDAVLAVNGDFYGSRTEGFVIRNGVLYRDTAGRNREGLAILADGSFVTYNEADTSTETLLAQGAVQAFSFGPALLTGGQIAVSKSEEVGKAMASNPRTAIGMVDELHYVFVVSDGRSSASVGLSLYELADVMQSIGVREAYNLDGGGSSTMVFQGSVINNPTTTGRKTGERDVSDIVYIGG